MICIDNIRIEKINETSRLCADVKYNKKTTTLWYEVEKKYEKYLCHERADAFLIAILLFAMEHNQDIKIINTPVSAKLLFNLTNYVLPTISKANPKYHQIEITAKTSSTNLKTAGYNGTGISRGVDSFYTIMEHTLNCDESLKVNCLTFFNVGSHKDFGGEEGRQLFQKRLKTSEKFAEANHYQFIWVDSNISEFVHQIFSDTYIYRTASAVLAIQKMFKNYYLSSSFPIYEIKIDETVLEYPEIFHLAMLGTENISFYSSGCTKGRQDKVNAIANYKPAQKNLNVCFEDEINCGKCEKCQRTIFGLYANNSLDSFNKVFDTEYFKNNIDKYEISFVKNYFARRKIDHEYQNIYKELRKNNKNIKLKNKIKGLLYYELKIISTILPSRINKNLKKLSKKISI